MWSLKSMLTLIGPRPSDRPLVCLSFAMLDPLLLAAFLCLSPSVVGSPRNFFAFIPALYPFKLASEFVIMLLRGLFLLLDFFQDQFQI